MQLIWIVVDIWSTYFTMQWIVFWKWPLFITLCQENIKVTTPDVGYLCCHSPKWVFFLLIPNVMNMWQALHGQEQNLGWQPIKKELCLCPQRIPVYITTSVTALCGQSPTMTNLVFSSPSRISRFSYANRNIR